MKFQNDLYQKIHSEYRLEKATEDSKKDLVKRVYEAGKSFAMNYNPFIGYLPVKKQKDLKDKKRKIFGSLDVQVATIASAVGLGLGAYFIGQHLNGFDMGFEMMQKVRFSWTEVGELPKYISFPLIWGGFSKAATDAVSYYLIAESAVRAAAGIAGKPLGCLVGEAYYYMSDKLSKRSKSMKQREEEIAQAEKQLCCAKDFTEAERKECENAIARLSKQLNDAVLAKDKQTELNLKKELDKLLNNLEQC
ncbi:hypothetical protein FJZ53_00005 [Candidatus Woesearchaeota archaeon]|nr:hypothetical protein [Candidatus Woesearchaeota archaeon]